MPHLSPLASHSILFGLLALVVVVVAVLLFRSPRRAK